MSLPPAFLDEVRSRTGLAELIGRRVKLTKRGKEHLGLCPFHDEKTPSFTVNEEKGFYHCFGCQAHGRAFDFVRQASVTLAPPTGLFWYEILTFIDCVESAKVLDANASMAIIRRKSAERRIFQAGPCQESPTMILQRLRERKWVLTS